MSNINETFCATYSIKLNAIHNNETNIEWNKDKTHKLKRIMQLWKEQLEEYNYLYNQINDLIDTYFNENNEKFYLHNETFQEQLELLEKYHIGPRMELLQWQNNSTQRDVESLEYISQGQYD
jgi:hypothetical protein